MFGIDASVETIENFFQIPIDYYARVSFNSLIQIIDIIDGVNVDVEIDFCEQDENRSFKKEDLICLEAGQQTLNGKQALAYARHRKTIGFQNTSDLDCANYLKEQLSNAITYTPYDAMDYTTLLFDLRNDTIPAVAISENFYEMAIAYDDTLIANLRIIETYIREKLIEYSTKDITKEAFTIYLSGLDNVGSPDQQTRTDTNLILIVNPRAKHIGMVSLPRDG